MRWIRSGFSLFLWIVIQRLASLLKDKATAKAEASAAKSQAESASRTAELLLDQNKEKEEKGGITNKVLFLIPFIGADEVEQELKDKVKEMEKKLESAQKELREANKELNQKDVRQKSFQLYSKLSFRRKLKPWNRRQKDSPESTIVFVKSFRNDFYRWRVYFRSNI